MENEIAWRAVAAVKVPKAFPGMAVGKNPPNPVDKYAKNGIILFRHAGVAQLVEQLTCNQQVGGSSPLAGSRNIKGLWKIPQTLFVPLPWRCLVASVYFVLRLT